MDNVPLPPPLPWREIRTAARERLPDGEVGFLEEALELSRRGWGGVRPNPLVGCVLVRDGRVVGRGWHERFGEDHAEVRALADAGDGARGATAYVTLEPCTHHGKTPPCTRALHEAGVSQVVFGAGDPSPEAGGGGEALGGLGVEVTGPVLPEGLARSLDPRFFHRARRGSGPWVALKLAMDLRGSIAAAPGRRTAVSGPEAGAYTHRLRAGFDAIVVGSATAAVDDPLLTVRGDIDPRQAPMRVVLDSGARLDPGSRLLDDAPEVPLLVLCADDAPVDRVVALKEAGSEVVRVPRTGGGAEPGAGRGSGVETTVQGGGSLDLEAVLECLDARGVGCVLCEGGATLASSLLREDRIHRIHLFVAPRLLGPSGVPGFAPDTVVPPDCGWRALAAGEALGRDAHLVFDRHPESGSGSRTRQ